MDIERELALEDAIRALLRRDELNTCRHEETYRAGSLWEICHSCGAKWADDEGGKPAWKDPPEWVKARELLMNRSADWRLVQALAVLYAHNPVLVAEVCDTRLDPSGNLLGRVRERYREAMLDMEQSRV